ncbi:MAG: PKD domain-containing protein, partial [Bacteroidales bacterium]|nr:PKD domain-containing protein [Bacteroidales bacterium]
LDYWKITIDEDGRLSIQDTTESHLDYYISLYDADGTTLIRSELRYKDNSGTRIGVNVSPGIYYLRLDRYGTDYYTYGSYRIYPLFEPVTFPGDPEPNDSVSVAKIMKLDTLISGNLGSRRDGIYDDFDWWEINLSEGGLLTLTDSTESHLDYYMKLYESDGTTLIRSVLRYKDNSGSRISEKLSKGAYYLLLDKYGTNYYTYGSYIVNPGFLPKPKADFEVSQDIRSFSFTNKSMDGETFYWDFDDGESSDQVNPSHTYNGPGDYLVTLIVSNTAGADTATQEITIYGVSGVSPQTGGNSGEVTLTILGGGFSEDASVTLSRDGSNDLVAENVYYYERGAVRATFNLSGAGLGEWDITVNNPGKAPIVEEKAFTIIQATEPEPWVNLSGRTKALFNRWQTYTLEYGNTGNVDADIVPVWITVSDPENNELEFLDMDVLVPDYAVDNNQEARLDSITWYFDLDTLWGKIEPTRVYPLYIPKIPAGYTGNIKFRIKTSTQVKINVWNNAPLMENGTLKALCLEGNSLLGQCIEQAKNRAIRDLALTYIGLIPGGGCITSVTKEFFAIRDMRMESFSKRRSWGSFTYAMTGLFLGCVADFFPVTKLYQLAIAVTSTIQYLHDGIYQADKDCHEKFGMNSHKNKNIRGVYSFDPNEIIGPAGYGSGNYIEPVGTAVYTVYFENKDTATAPAQEIWVIDTLDINKFNLDEFSFGTVSIGDTTINLLFGQKEFSMDIDFRPAKQLIGRVIGKLDTLNGVVSVYFNSLDPITMQQNEDPALGILPPNVSSPEGEGSVSFSVGLYDLVNGESFENKAMITFDFNEPIYTNTWLNTIDDQAPVSKIESYSYVAENNEVILNLSGSDNLAGIEYYMIYASINDS